MTIYIIDGTNIVKPGCYGADKRRFGWLIRQKREDRREMALFSITLLHNIFTVRVRPG